jgi:tetratricopeptide (TPR) repeat protein
MQRKVSGDPGQATRLFLAALERSPRLGTVDEHLAETTRDFADRKLASGDTLSVERLYEHILGLGLRTTDFYNDYATLLAERGRLQEAEAGYRAALALQPGNLQVRTNLALALFFLGRAPEAVAEMQSLLERRPAYVPARLQLGDFHAQAGDSDGALREYRLALETSPHSADAWLRIGLVIQQRSGCRQAVEALEKAQRLDPARPDIVQALAACYRELGEGGKADGLMRSAGTASR